MEPEVLEQGDAPIHHVLRQFPREVPVRRLFVLPVVVHPLAPALHVVDRVLPRYLRRPERGGDPWWWDRGISGGRGTRERPRPQGSRRGGTLCVYWVHPPSQKDPPVSGTTPPHERKGLLNWGAYSVSFCWLVLCGSVGSSPSAWRGFKGYSRLSKSCMSDPSPLRQ